ncbi:MAG: hypothetical protein EXS31_03595 [Pedosphaera sp.]|nr:hypothetical protein [Pedosphaera sp.]
MDLTRLPIARELFAQWRKARGERIETATRPFSRLWRQLLAGAVIVSAVDEDDAKRDARALADAGLVELRLVRYRPDIIERILIPLATEPRWRDAFGLVPPSDEEAERIREFPWCAQLGFVPGARLSLSFDELKQINAYFIQKARDVSVPIKERSLEIFGDEKRLDILFASSALFGEGRLTLEQFRCYVVAEPLAWIRGAAPAGPVIVLENLATWSSYSAWDSEQRLFSAIVYGGGIRLINSVLMLPDMFREVGGTRRVLYFGDLDSMGLRIPRVASARAQAANLPAIEPDFWSYTKLLHVAKACPKPFNADCVDFTDEDFAWLGPLADQARAVVSSGKRLPQELLGWEVLRSQKRTDPDPNIQRRDGDKIEVRGRELP